MGLNNGFPQFECWNEGRYVYVGVGAKPESKTYPEFRVYDSETKSIVSIFDRKSNELNEFMLNDVFYHSMDPDYLVFIFVNGQDYIIVEANMIENHSNIIWTLSSDNFSFVTLDEDSSWIFACTK